MLDSISSLISAIASLAWPVVALITLLAFKRNLQSLLDRIYHAKLLGGEFEFEREREKLSRNVEQIEIKQKDENEADKTSNTRKIIRHNVERVRADFDVGLLERAIDDDPAYAIVLISASIEKALSRTLAGYDVKTERQSVRRSAELARRFGYGVAFQQAIDRFSNIRNMIVHGHPDVESKDLRSVAKLGLRILEYIALREAQPVYIHEAGLKVYSDSSFTIVVPDLEGIVIVYSAIPGVTGTHVVAATERKGYYHVDEEVLPSWKSSWIHESVFIPESEEMGISFLDLEQHGLFDGRKASELLQMSR